MDFNHGPQLAQQIIEEFVQMQHIIKDLHSQNQYLLNRQANPPQTQIFSIPSDLRRSADAVTDGQYVYLRKAETNTLFKIDTQTGHHVECPCNYIRCSIVFFNNTLYTVGGATSKERIAPRSDELLGMVNGQWVEFSRMPTKRSRTTALTFGALIIVIGGENEKGETLRTVEVLNTTENQWYRGQDLPDSRCCSSGTIVNECIYILGGWREENHAVSSVLRCTVAALRVSCIPVTQPFTQDAQVDGNRVWETLSPLPVEEAACTSFQNMLLVVGGRANKEPVQDIRTYDPVSKSWRVVGYLKNPRYICFAIGLNNVNSLIILGGRISSTTTEDTMEILS